MGKGKNWGFIDTTQAGEAGGGGEVVPGIARSAKLVNCRPMEEQVSHE